MFSPNQVDALRKSRNKARVLGSPDLGDLGGSRRRFDRAAVPAEAGVPVSFS